ncbi:MAG: hypothetical protein FWD09_00480 [Lentimicrobiaceae bacterium]|nr:hypothetical protein [Lentimicrobiaceae bacterium]
MKNQNPIPPAPTFESTWASSRKAKWQMLKAEQQMKEANRRMKEQMQEQMQETGLKMQETDRRMKELQKLMGSWSTNHGSFAEEYFFNAFENGKQDFFGEHFNKIRKKVKYVELNLEDEYDIVLYNDNSVAIIEVKYKAHENDIPSVLKKAETFRILCPSYKDFKIYLGFASMSFYEELEQECIKQGIAVIKQVGDTVVINDSHLRVF